MKKAIALILFVFVLTIGTALTVSADDTSSEYFNAYSLDTVEPESTCSYYCSWCEATDYGCDAHGNCC